MATRKKAETALLPRRLHPFEGRDVVATTVAITAAGDGLSESMSVDPSELELGQRVNVVLQCEVTKIRYEELKDTGVLRRVHILRAGLATIVDDELVQGALLMQAEKLREARELAAGIQHLPLASSNGDGD